MHAPRFHIHARLGITATPAANDRWTLNTGAPVTTAVPAINGGRPIRLVVDLASLAISARTLAIAEHVEAMRAVVGMWDQPKVDAAGLTAHLSLVDDESLPEARRVKALLAGKVPLQASIGVDAPDGEASYILLTAPETINGRAINPADSRLPTYVLRNGKLTEASVLLFGADSATGPQTSNPDGPGVEPAQRAALDARRRQLVAAQAKVAALAGERDRLRAALAKAQAAAIANAAADEANDEPSTVAAALQQLRTSQRGMSMERRLQQVRVFYPHLARHA